MHVSSITQRLNKICFFQALIKILGKLQETRYQAKGTLSTVRNDSSFRCTAGTYILTQSQESGSKVGRWWVGRCIRVAWEGPAAESRRGPKKRLQLLLLACCCRCPLPRPFLTRGTAHFFFFFWIYDPSTELFRCRERDFSAFLLCLYTTSLNSQLCQDRCLIEYRVST